MNSKFLCILVLCFVAYATANDDIFIDYKTIEDKLAQERAIAIDTSKATVPSPNVLALNFSRYVQTRSVAGKFDMYSLCEPIKTDQHSNGFDRNRMITAAFRHSKYKEEIFQDHLHQLLQTYVRRNFQVGRSNWPTMANASLLDQYEVVDGLPHGITDEVMTMPRLTAAFPFETAYLIKNPHQDSSRSYIHYRSSENSIPGERSLISNTLVFWYAPLIIPTSWNATHKYWKEWFHSFAIKVVGFPLPTELEERMDAHYNSMIIISERDEAINVERMKLLGISKNGIFG